ncbi:potassium-transporting ATPase subunit KdpC [Clostridium baratii]|uniref:Potassium-transporting ATPase KdpC subunit n=1 Tax=Clostridium baratii str. Sullivan TaxID=1415775 RepID=A0A0A7G1G2_9CLOT|nr:potassium-transporting ATPase subunit KdpC [Clostridium baratii]AIY84801.1 K+-transporting ATPase, C subunit [Clostridium baratii str. Sullivan]MDU1054016.1 potassium-transporting ATPase subunit KdpC [Clostridium baratii]MDU4912619.1 potassium-transporting ATPase subunit KdpC [Clostridium baratii]CUO86531.1 potassium-transporting ATPase subunit C [Clostridium baratii]
MRYFNKGLRITVSMIIICGIIYPLLITGIGQLFFNYEANGSVMEVDGKEVGSELIGQIYNEEKYFNGRVSAVNYNISDDGKEIDSTSGSQNLGPTSEVLKERVEKDIENFLKKNPTVSRDEITEELISQSGSGLDPHITVRGAEIQIDRISKVTGISKDRLKMLIEENKEGKLLGLYGAERVNVLKLNIGIDKILKEE